MRAAREDGGQEGWEKPREREKMAAEGRGGALRPAAKDGKEIEGRQRG